MTERLRTDGQIYSPRVCRSCNDQYFIVTVLSVMDSILWGRSCIYWFYYETIKREFKIKPIPECRWDERLYERIALDVGCLVVIFRPGDAYFGPAARTGACLTTICFSFCVPVASYEHIGDIGADVRISAGLPAARLTPTASTCLRR
jgi:hypothetical protein